MANKTVVVEKNKDTKGAPAGIIEPGSQTEGVGKQPEAQKVLNVTGDTVTSDVAFFNAPSEDAKEVHLNHVGQKVDTPVSDHEAYITPEGKTMFVQMEEADQVFAGEHGKNAKWFPKTVVKTWTKHEPTKVKEAK